jgi:arylsulfatase A-like enzyme
MKRYALAILLLAISAATTATTAATAAERPNILFCFADDWGWPHAGAYGDPVVKTPTFDRLAREGVLFTHAFISAPSCTPSRNAIITGQQFYRLEEGANLRGTLDVELPNFMMLMREAGYAIGHWRKAWGPGNYKSGGYKEHPCGPESRFDQFLQRRPKDKPFCFWFGTSDPHRAYAKGSGKKSGMDLSKVHVPEFFPDVPTIRGDIADYYFEVERWDGDVGKALALLDKHGELDNTIVVMSGDHGFPFPRGKGTLYDWGSRVPLAIRWGKQVRPGRTVTDFVSLTDLAPTFLEAAGLPVPESMTGRSLVSLLGSDREGRVEIARDFVVTGRERHAPAQEIPSIVGYPSRAIRTDGWLYIMNLKPDRWPHGVPENASHPMNRFPDTDDSPSKFFIMDHRDDPKFRRYFELCFAKRPAEELYDCNADPDQVNNLADDPKHAKIKQRLHDRLTDYLHRTGDPRFTDAPVKFDEYPYTARYMKGRLEKWRKQNEE